MYHFGPYQQTFLTVVFVICVAYVIIGTVKLMLKKPVALGLHIALFIGSLCLPVGFFILATAFLGDSYKPITGIGTFVVFVFAQQLPEQITKRFFPDLDIDYGDDSIR